MIPAYIPITVIDEMIAATGFGDLGQGADVDYKCRWLLERIGIMKTERDFGAIAHDYPEMDDLIKLNMQQRAWNEDQQKTINTLWAKEREYQREIESLKRRLEQKRGE